MSDPQVPHPVGSAVLLPAVSLLIFFDEPVRPIAVIGLVVILVSHLALHVHSAVAE